MELAVRRWSGGTRRALLVHGMSSNADGWWRVGPALAELGYDVLAPDLRGHGTSLPGADYMLGSYAQDLAELGSEWDLAVGHSLGGAAVALASANDPRFARRIVLEDPALIIPDNELALQWLVEPFDGEITAATVAAGSPTWHPEDARIKAEAMLQSGRQVVERTIEHNPVWNIIEVMFGLQVPTLLIGADPDNGAIVPPVLGESLASSNPLIDFLWIPKSSHSIHRDEFEPFIEAVRRFVS